MGRNANKSECDAAAFIKTVVFVANLFMIIAHVLMVVGYILEYIDLKPMLNNHTVTHVWFYCSLATILTGICYTTLLVAFGAEWFKQRRITYVMNGNLVASVVFIVVSPFIYMDNRHKWLEDESGRMELIFKIYPAAMISGWVTNMSLLYVSRLGAQSQEPPQQHRPRPASRAPIIPGTGDTRNCGQVSVAVA